MSEYTVTVHQDIETGYQRIHRIEVSANVEYLAIWEAARVLFRNEYDLTDITNIGVVRKEKP